MTFASQDNRKSSLDFNAAKRFELLFLKDRNN